MLLLLDSLLQERQAREVRSGLELSESGQNSGKAAPQKDMFSD